MSKPQQKPNRRLSAQTVFLAAAVVISCVVFAYLVFFDDRRPDGNAKAAVSQLRLEDVPFNGARAYEYLKDLCVIGRRPSGSPGMAAQQKLLTAHFQKAGGQVELQRFRIRHPTDGSPVAMANLIVRWHPRQTRRILLCAHYDTLPFPMLDPVDKRGSFVGANDGASGVAVLMELAHEMPDLQCKYGVDFALFDGEEFVFDEQGRYFLGSEWFARMYVKNRPPYRYRWGVLLDMIGDADLQIYQERYSTSWRDTRPLVEDLWATARRLGVREFIPRRGYAVRDDHLMLHNVGKIPCCDVIDFDYPAWHTQRDTPARCSPLSLAKVGWVIREWLKAVY
jgi:glutaminyl-peptide cyclotransferase